MFVFCRREIYLNVSIYVCVFHSKGTKSVDEMKSAVTHHHREEQRRAVTVQISSCNGDYKEGDSRHSL